MTKKMIVQMLMPWFDFEGELNYCALTITCDNKVDRRRAFRAIRNWYSKEIGITVCKTTLYRIWKFRHTTFSRDADFLEDYINNMVRKSYEEIVNRSGTFAQEETSGSAKV